MKLFYLIDSLKRNERNLRFKLKIYQNIKRQKNKEINSKAEDWLINDFLHHMEQDLLKYSKLY